MTTMMPIPNLPKTLHPQRIETKQFLDAELAWRQLHTIYSRNTAFLRDAFDKALRGDITGARVRATYPFVRVTTPTFGKIDSRLSYGFVHNPGTYETTITAPKLFAPYLVEQLSLLIRNHNVPVEVGESAMPIPLHFALGPDLRINGSSMDDMGLPLRDMFDVPNLADVDDEIVNAAFVPREGTPLPLAPFNAPRIDFSLARLSHYTATNVEHFQNFVLFTNYQFYIEEFCKRARAWMAQGIEGYTAFVEPGNVITPNVNAPHIVAQGTAPARHPQMPAYHLKREGHAGITMVNIGVGPSNAKTITDHVAVLRPHAWLMLGHCAGLRNSQSLGDYVLAHGYVREDKVLDADLPTWVPIPALAEVQVALEEAVAEVTQLTGYEVKRIMRTGTVASIDNRNWELRDHREPLLRLSQSRAIALEMESATIAANGFRFRVPYGTLLCVSDKPLHGELKLPGMAGEFYRRQVGQHLDIGLLALEKLRNLPMEQLHSRKLRSFAETAFQ